MALDLDQLVSDMQVAASGVVQADVTTLRGFAQAQLQAIAQQAELVTTGILTKQITSATQQFFLDGLEDMALSFAKTLRGLLMVTVEKVWNAVVGVLWGAISKATNLVLPAPVMNSSS